MKLTYIYTFFVLGIVAFVAMGSSGGRAAAANWGNTGAPGDQMINGVPRTCISCHGTDAGTQMQISLGIKDAAGADVTSGEYIPGETYSMTVTLDAVMGAPTAFGFQMLCLNAPIDENGPEVSNYSNPGANVQVATASNTARTYAEQMGASSSSEFTIDWTAPAKGTGGVTFYLCGNGVNENMSTTGDGADCTKVELAEDVTSSTTALAGYSKVLISPNPSQGAFSLLLQGQKYQNGQLSIRDMSGRMLHQENLNSQAGESVQQVTFDPPAKGLYLVQLSTAQGIHTEKLMIQ